MTQINDTFAQELQAQADKTKLFRAADFAFRACVAVPLTLLVAVEVGGWIASLLG